MYIGNTPFQGLVGGGNILDASIEGVDLSTSAIAARLGYTPVDPGAAAFTATLTAKDIQQDNATYIKGKLAAGTATRLFGLNVADTLYIGSVDANHTGGTLFVKNGTTQMTLDAASNLTVVGDLINNGGRLSLYRSAGASYIDWASGQSLNFRTETSAGGAGASTLMTVDATGRLGVGTQSPAYLIHAVGAGEDKAEIQAQNTSTAGNARGNLRVKSATSTYGGGVMMTNGTDTAYPTSALCLYNYDNQPVIFGTNNAERARIDATGKVGINDTNPTTLLSIAGGTAATLGISITPSGWNNAKHRFHVPTSGDTSVWSFNYSGSAVDFASYGTSSVSVASGTVYIGIGGANTAPSTKATFNSTGLGVGMTPSVALDVYSAGSGIIRVRGGTGNNEGSAFYVTKAANTGTLCAFGDWARIGGGTPDQITALWTADTPLMFHVYNAERMRIDTAGRLGIGTTSPTNGYKITIASSDNSSRIIQYQATTQADINPYVVGGIDLADVPRDGVSSNPAAYMRFINRNTNSNFATAIRGLDIAFGTMDGNSGQGTAASERMRITSAGYVGIGTATPAVEFDVRNRSRVGDGTNTITSGTWDGFSNRIESVGRPLFLTSYNDSIRFGMSGSEVMRIHNNSNVGIGTTSPSTALHVVATDTSANRTSTLNAVTITAESGQSPYTGFGPSVVFAARAYNSGIVNSTRITSEINNDSINNYGGSLGFDVTPTVGGTLTRAMTIRYDSTIVTKSPMIVGRGMTGEGGYAIEAPFAVSLPVYTYYNGSGYSNYAARLCKLTVNGGDARFVATIYSRGDYNYSYMAAETHIDIAKWSNSLGTYEFFGKEVLGSENIRFAMDANGYIWYHFGSLWTQDHVMVIHRMQNVELAITNTTYHDSTLAWKTVPAGGAYNEENSWGS